MPPRLLAVDLDGTLLDPTGTPHAHDVKAIHAALAAGIAVSIVTGRLYSGTRAAVQILGLRGPVGFDNQTAILVNAKTDLISIVVCSPKEKWIAAQGRRHVFAEPLP